MPRPFKWRRVCCLPENNRYGPLNATANESGVVQMSVDEYETIRLSLIEKYGEEGKDERGQPTFVLKMESPNFKTFCDELAPFNKMTHEVELMTAKYSEAEGNLTGEEILAIDWMLED